MSMERGAAECIDHLAVAVADLDAAVDRFQRLLGIEPAWRGEDEGFEVRVAVFHVGAVKLELLEGTSPDSTVSRFVNKRGPGLHHVCIAVEDLKTTLERVRTEGFEVVGTGGETGVEGRPVAFVHPKDASGVLVEFIEGFDERRE